MPLLITISKLCNVPKNFYTETVYFEVKMLSRGDKGLRIKIIRQYICGCGGHTQLLHSRAQLCSGRWSVAHQTASRPWTRQESPPGKNNRWAATSFFQGLLPPREGSNHSRTCTAGRLFTHWCLSPYIHTCIDYKEKNQPCFVKAILLLSLRWKFLYSTLSNIILCK